MKKQFKKNGFKASAVVLLLALSQSVLAAGTEQMSRSSFSGIQAIGSFALLIFLLVAPVFKNSSRAIK